MVYNECVCKDLMEQLQNEITSAKALEIIDKGKIPDVQSSIILREIVDSKRLNEDRLSKIIDDNCTLNVRKYKDIIRQCKEI